MHERDPEAGSKKEQAKARFTHAEKMEISPARPTHAEVQHGSPQKGPDNHLPSLVPAS